VRLSTFLLLPSVGCLMCRLPCPLLSLLAEVSCLNSCGGRPFGLLSYSFHCPALRHCQGSLGAPPCGASPQVVYFRNQSSPHPILTSMSNSALPPPLNSGTRGLFVSARRIPLGICAETCAFVVSLLPRRLLLTFGLPHRALPSHIFSILFVFRMFSGYLWRPFLPFNLVSAGLFLVASIRSSI